MEGKSIPTTMSDEERKLLDKFGIGTSPQLRTIADMLNEDHATDFSNEERNELYQQGIKAEDGCVKRRTDM